MIHFGGNDCLKSAVIFLSIGRIDGGRTRIPPTWSWPPFSEASLMLSLGEFQFFVPFLFSYCDRDPRLFESGAISSVWRLPEGVLLWCGLSVVGLIASSQPHSCGLQASAGLCSC